MSESKVFMFPDATTNSGNGSNLDPNLLFSMMNNGNGFGGNSWIWVIFLFFLYGWNRNGGLFGNGTDGNSASQVERDMLMQAINGNRSAIQALAGDLNCDINSIQTAVNNVQAAVQSVGSQVGLSGQQVINSVQQGNMTLAQQIANCCCENKQLVTSMGYEGQLRDQANTASILGRVDQFASAVQQGFASVGYESAQQTCSIQNSIKDQTQTVMDKLAAMEANAQQDKINTLTAQLTAANSRAERSAELKPILDELNAIKSAQPSTTTIQYPNIVGVPMQNFMGYGGYGYGYGSNGFWG